MTPKTEEIVHAVDYINEFEKTYYTPIKTKFDKLDKHKTFHNDKEAEMFKKLSEQEMFLRNMIKNLRGLVEVNILEEQNNLEFVMDVERLKLIKDNKVRSNLIPIQVELLTRHINNLKNKL